MADTPSMPIEITETEHYVFTNGWILEREYGRVYLPINDGIGVEGNGKWVLTDDNGVAVDMDKYLNDISERYKDQIGEGRLVKMQTRRVARIIS